MAENTFLAGLMVCALCTVLLNRCLRVVLRGLLVAGDSRLLACVLLLADPVRPTAGVRAPLWRYTAMLPAGFLLSRDDTLRNLLLRHGTQISLLPGHNDYSGTVSNSQAGSEDASSEALLNEGGAAGRPFYPVRGAVVGLGLGSGRGEAGVGREGARARGSSCGLWLRTARK